MILWNLLFQKVVTFDCETSTINKGNPYTVAGSLVTIQTKVNDEETHVFREEAWQEAVPNLTSASVVVGANLKFDLAWLRRVCGAEVKSVWDIQLAEYIISRQEWKYPDLATMCTKYGIGVKPDFIKLNYWDKGIDTKDIPPEELDAYGISDVENTYKIFLKQVEYFQNEGKDQFRLFRMHCNDLLVLLDMEYNGIVYDVEASLAEVARIEEEQKKIEEKIYAFTRGVPINLNSGDHKSVLLYGGTIKVERRVPVGFYKSGDKIGLPRYKVLEDEFHFERLIEPLKNSELAKEGYFSTDEPTLTALPARGPVKKLIALLLERSKMTKLIGTYLTGYPKMMEKNGWNPGLIHTSLNQCQAITGRLSSTKPNLQNTPKEAKKFCITRY